MAYQIYLIQQYTASTENVYIQLDVDGIDMTTLFRVSDIADISSRQDTMTHNIAFKGSKTNNQAFGSLFLLNRRADIGIDNRLFFNYSPDRVVDCLLYEDNMLLLRGTMLVTDMQIDKYKNITYNTTITGKLIQFTKQISTSYLTDLNYLDMQHRYTVENVTNSWATSIEKYSGSTSVTGGTYYNTPFQLGSNYLYPFIDYGIGFKSTTGNTDYNTVNILNLKPGIYVKEYFDRIFAFTSGYTYEIKGSSDFITKFNSLVVPSTTDYQAFTVPASATSITMNCFSGDTHRNTQLTGDEEQSEALVNFSNITKTGLDIGLIDFNYQSFQIDGGYTAQNVFLANKQFTASIRVDVGEITLTNKAGIAYPTQIQLCVRDNASIGSGTDIPPELDTFNVVGNTEFTVPAASGSPTTFTFPPMTLIADSRQYNQGSQFVLKIQPAISLPFGIFEDLDVAWATITLPYQSPITYNIVVGDLVTPSIPSNIKMLDFLKGIINQFNLYMYNTNDNPTHFIFEKYDDFYSLCQPQYLKHVALDWTNKIDFTSSIDIASNLNLPKNYTFTYKSDNDWFNSYYSKLYNQIYGTLYFTDSLGIIDAKTIELPFSPSPTVSYAGTGRFHPAILAAQPDLNTSVGLPTKKPVASNMRLLYYNGVRSCNNYNVESDSLTGNTYLNLMQFTGNTYPLVSNYYYSTGATLTPTDDLNFNYPQEYFFNVSNDYLSLPNSYSNYYINQTTELTNINLFTVTCEAYLNEVDINNLDLSVPVFIDMGEFGNYYFKVLSVAYSNNKATSTVTLQKIGSLDADEVGGGTGGCTLAIAVTNTPSSENNGTATVTYSGNSGAVSILWSNGSSGSTITGLFSGTYTVTVTDAAGCSVSGSTVVSYTGEDVCISVTGTLTGGNLMINATASNAVDVNLNISFEYGIGGFYYSNNITILSGSDNAYKTITGVTGSSVEIINLSFSPTYSSSQHYVQC